MGQKLLLKNLTAFKNFQGQYEPSRIIFTIEHKIQFNILKENENFTL